MGKKHKRKKSAGPRLRKELRPTATEAKPKKGLDRFYIWVVLVMCLVSFFVHLHGADYMRRQGMITFDESIYARLGFQLKSGGEYHTQEIYKQQKKLGRTLPSYVNRPVFHHPPLYPWTVSMIYSFMEQKDAYSMEELYETGVKVSNLAGCGLILIVFFFARRLFNPHVALLASFFVSFDFNILMCSTKNWIDMTLGFLVWLTLLFLYRSTENKYFFYVSGVTMGLALLTKYTAVLVFPIFLSYGCLFHRDIFKQKEFYFFFGIAGLIFSPWLAHNISVFGLEDYIQTTFGTKYKHRLLQFAKLVGLAVVFLASVLAARKYIFPKRDRGESFSCWSWVGTAAAALFFAYLSLHKPFWISFYKSWQWEPALLLGWDMGLYNQEPWYFYIKQHLEYSPLYLIAFVGFILSFRQRKGDVFCALTAFWVLTFGILWKNFQGRYVINFPPAAMMLAAVSIWRYSAWLLAKRNVYAKVVFGVSVLILAYAIAKTLHVDLTYALNDSVAYF